MRNKKYRSTAVAIIIGCTLQPDLAWTNDVATGRITDTETRHQQKVEDVTSSTEIISKEDIEAVAADTVEDALAYSTSVYFYQNMMRSTPSIRGFDGKHTLILIDGKRYAGPQGKYDDPTRFTAGNIERIEVVRGPMSSLYGSEAMGGVINIITKKAGETHFDAGIRYGNYSHGDGTTNLSFNMQLAEPDRKDYLRKIFCSLSGQQIWQDKLMLGNGTTLVPDVDTGSLTGNLGIALSDSVSLDFGGGYNKSDKDSILMISDWLAENSNAYSSYDFSGSLSYKSERLNGMIRGYSSHYEKDYEKRYTEGPLAGKISSNGTDFDDGTRDTGAIEASGDTLFSSSLGDHFVTLGGEFRHENCESVRVDNDLNGFICRDFVCIPLGTYDQNSYAMYLQDEWIIGESFSFVPSIRYDNYDGFDGEWSPKVGLVYRVNEQWRGKANYGHSFRVPGVGELFRDYYGMGGRYHIIGNRNLEPETSDSFDFALESSGRNWFGRIGYFYNNVNDLIHTEFQSMQQDTLTYLYKNIDKAILQGVELEGSWQVMNSLKLGFNYTYLDARDDTTDDRLTDKPRHLATAKLDYTYLPWDLLVNFRVRYMGDYSYIVGGHEMEEQFRNDSEFINSIKLTKGINDFLDLYAGIDNIFDNYTAFYGSTADDGVLENPGAFFYAGLKIRN